MNRVKKIIVIICSIVLFGNAFGITSFASTQNQEAELNGFDEQQFENLVDLVNELNRSIGDEQEVFDTLEDIANDEIENRSVFDEIGDIWNALTDSEKKLLIKYPFDALKVNTAKNIATTQTNLKFGYNGLGDRSDAFRHGIWNAEMTILIGETKAELFATAHEDKDTSGTEADGFSKEEHKIMDLHNNSIGRETGRNNASLTEEEMAEIIYRNIYSEASAFVWLHE